MDSRQHDETVGRTGQKSAAVSTGRRRFFRGAAGGAGVLLTVHAKTALGTGICKSPSATMSGNMSPRPGDGTTCSGGRSPGFWKVPQHFQYWGPAGATAPTFNIGVTECASGMQNLELANILTPGTLLSAAGITGGSSTGVGLWAVLAFPNSFNPGGQLMRHLAAAWLNAGYFTSAATKYPVTRPQIIAMWEATRSGGLYCPNLIIGQTCTTGWTADQVITYISGMYDINDGVGPDLCKVP